MIKKVLLFGFVLLLASAAFAQSGTVKVYEGNQFSGNLLFTATVQADGTYTGTSSAVTNAVNAGVPIVAVYSGDAGFTGSVSPIVTDVVNSAVQATTTTLTVAPNPAKVGDVQTFSGKVTASQ